MCLEKNVSPRVHHVFIHPKKTIVGHEYQFALLRQPSKSGVDLKFRQLTDLLPSFFDKASLPTMPNGCINDTPV